VTAALTGLGSGALHAVAGPDHVLSLAPLSVGRLRGAWRIGLSWGLGHGAGTLLLALLASALPLEAISAWAARAAGLALAATGVANLVALRRARAGGPAPAPRGSVFTVGLVHGVTGAAALLLLLPGMTGVAGDRALYLGGFTLGSAVAMAGLTAALSALPRVGPFAAGMTRRLPHGAAGLSVAVGLAWAALA
jgi:hypothetical protein